MTRAIALLLLLGSLLPIANLLPGGESDPGYLGRLSDWMLGIALCSGIGVLGWFLARNRAAAPDVAVETPGAASDHRFALLVAAVGLLVYVSIALGVYDGRPLLIDEIVQVLQARDYAAGRLSQPTFEPREFVGIMNQVDIGARTYGQYPAGGPAMMVPGVWLGAEWLIGPVVGAVCIVLFAQMLNVLEPDASLRFRRATLLLFAATPFGAFMFGSHMNHTTTLLWLMVAVVALAALQRSTGALDAGLASGASAPRLRLWYALACGLGLGIAATIRPLDSVAFALPAGLWLLWRALRAAPETRGAALRELVASGVGVALPLLGLFWVNLQTTGHALRFGYDVLWGAGHSIGFHQAAWGSVHTPARGFELISIYLTRLSTYLFETPFPALLPAALGLWFARRLSAMDRYLLVSAGLLLVGYWAYWHDGFFLGPRFMFPLLPLLVLWSARGVRSLKELLSSRRAAWRGVQWTLVAGGLYAVATVATVRVPTYRNGLVSMRVLPERESARAGVSNALVLVKESWGAQLVVRLWGRDISRADAEVLYRSVDACRLEMALTALEQRAIRGDSARRLLQPMLADSARLVPSPRSPDFTERLQPGLVYPGRCERRIAEDQGGFVLFSPWRLARDSNVYLRWLPGREREAAALFPGRPVYRLGRADASVDAPLVWERLLVGDSLR